MWIPKIQIVLIANLTLRYIKTLETMSKRAWLTQLSCIIQDIISSQIANIASSQVSAIEAFNKCAMIASIKITDINEII